MISWGLNYQCDGLQFLIQGWPCSDNISSIMVKPLMLVLLLKHSPAFFSRASGWSSFCVFHSWYPLRIVSSRAMEIVIVITFPCLTPFFEMFTGSLETSMEHFNCSDIDSTSDGRTKPRGSTWCRNCNYYFICIISNYRALTKKVPSYYPGQVLQVPVHSHLSNGQGIRHVICQLNHFKGQPKTQPGQAIFSRETQVSRASCRNSSFFLALNYMT